MPSDLLPSSPEKFLEGFVGMMPKNDRFDSQEDGSMEKAPAPPEKMVGQEPFDGGQFFLKCIVVGRSAHCLYGGRSPHTD